MAADDRGDWAREQLYRLVYQRDLHKRPIIVTTNLGLEGLKERLQGRTASRLFGMSEWVDIPTTITDQR
jgi:DNA replication protein DnaC